MATFGREIIHLWPWMDTNNWAEFDDFIDTSDYHHYGAMFNSGDALNDDMNFTINPNPGTWEIREFCRRSTTDGVAHFSLNAGGDLGTSDHDSGGGTIFEERLVTGSLTLDAPGDFKVSMDSTNTGGYLNYITLMVLARTGA